MVSLFIDEQSRKALKNAYLASDEEIDRINRVIGKDHPTYISLVDDKDYISLEPKLKNLIASTMGNSEHFPFHATDMLSFTLRGVVLDAIKIK